MSPPGAVWPQHLIASLAAFAVDAMADRTFPLLLGLSGLQGSGKSTLAAQLVTHCGASGIDAIALSLDDVYLTRAERLDLARDVHPLLATRGVPGTHDLALLHATLDALADAAPDTPAAVPRFDKGTDDRTPPATWPRIVAPPQLIVLEGWCIGVPPQPDATLYTPINTLERDEDPDGRWRRHINTALARDYAQLWQRLDRLLVLQAPSFDVVADWRDEQEQNLRNIGAPHAMSPLDVARFVAHYERISRQALATLPALADRVIALDRDRRPLA
ncbi:kinase [Chiayiivirga flava]|uniref:D-glycerate 3-kinase n=1 Tax=Chiayiivirga flava TaxID=659595 RepID=A0A7W8D474_9GAMM|nr:kinase [Chiayiivirga flava]MBB5207628.1 D-glycerate 3-kinase [Chiayiivirga flava]